MALYRKPKPPEHSIPYEVAIAPRCPQVSASSKTFQECRREEVVKAPVENT
jgi:hypothetical protein